MRSAPIEKQEEWLIHYIFISGKRGRSEDEIITWGRAPDYRAILNGLEDSGKVYHTKHLFTGIRYHYRAVRQ